MSSAFTESVLESAAVAWLESLGWVQGLQSLSQEEKDKILWRNLELLLGL